MGKYKRKLPHRRQVLADCQYGDVVQWRQRPYVRSGSEVHYAPSAIGLVAMRVGWTRSLAVFCRFYVSSDWQTEAPDTEPLHVVGDVPFEILRAKT